jgi:hypothetical protein
MYCYLVLVFILRVPSTVDCDALCYNIVGLGVCGIYENPSIMDEGGFSKNKPSTRLRVDSF